MPVAEPSAKKKKTKRKVGSSNDEYNVKSEIGIHGIAKMYPISRPDLISLFIANVEVWHGALATLSSTALFYHFINLVYFKIEV